MAEPLTITIAVGLWNRRCATEAMLREALASLRSNPDEYEPESWGIKCISDNNAIIDAALSATSSNWLARHDAEHTKEQKILIRELTEANTHCLEVIEERRLARCSAQIAEQQRDEALARAEKAEAERDALAAALVLRDRPLYPDEDVKKQMDVRDKAKAVGVSLLATRDARKVAEGRKAGLLEAANHCEESEILIPISEISPEQTKQQYSNVVIKHLTMELRRLAEETDK